MNQDFSFLAMISGSGIVVQLVLLILLFASCFSWFVFLKKRRELAKMYENNKVFLQRFHELTNLNEIYDFAKSMDWSPYAHMFRRGYDEMIKLTNKMGPNNVKESLYSHFSHFGLVSLERSLKKAINECNIEINSYMPQLASVGPLCPFIGLFGTVWGILRSFQGLSSGNVGLDVVAPGIAEALVATGIGLVVAIPAVFFYNQLVHRKSKMNSEMDSFAQDFLNIVERSLIHNSH